LLGRKRTRGFSKAVTYIYRKQLEEAEVIVVNKTDRLTEKQLADLMARLRRDYPLQRVFAISALESVGIEPWLSHLQSTACAPRNLHEIDYDHYADGEALLGWVNVTVAIPESLERLRAATIIDGVSRRIFAEINSAGYEVAHLKVAIEAENGAVQRMQTTSNADQPLLAGGLPENVTGGRLLVNLRVEASPEELRKIVAGALSQALLGIKHATVEFAAFKPGRPNPTRRVTDAELHAP
jgi:hypothetical protein